MSEGSYGIKGLAQVFFGRDSQEFESFEKLMEAVINRIVENNAKE
ncbi:hypothetical protein [Zhaonella formicivorans]|nr:hypothetical protein [Zhaonella formicivorans]